MELSVKAKEARRKYYREWRKNNPEKVKKNNQNYWERMADKMADKRGERNDNSKD